MDDRAYDLLEAKLRAQEELLANIYFDVLKDRTIAEIDSFADSMRTSFERSLTHPGRKAPSEFIRHATLHEIEEFWRVFRQTMLLVRGHGSSGESRP